MAAFDLAVCGDEEAADETVIEEGVSSFEVWDGGPLGSKRAQDRGWELGQPSWRGNGGVCASMEQCART